MGVNADTFLSVLDGRLTREENEKLVCEKLKEVIQSLSVEELLAYLLGTSFSFEPIQIEFTLAFPDVRDESLDQ